MSRFLIAFALAMPVALVAQEGAATEQKAAKTAMGEVVKFEAGSLTINKGKKAGEETIKLADDCKVTIDGKDAKAEDLKAGQRVTVTLGDNGATSVVVKAAEEGKKKKKDH